jgi:hypothetical protein
VPLWEAPLDGRVPDHCGQLFCPHTG